jgi:membrane fusion protein, heavy metal efflux system
MNRLSIATLCFVFVCGGGASATFQAVENGEEHCDDHEEAHDHDDHEEHGEHGEEHGAHADEHGEHADEHGEEHAHDALPTRVQLPERVIAEAGIVSEPVRLQAVAPNLIATGHVEADPGRTARISAKVPGIIEQVSFREGDFVKEGTVMAVVRAPGLGGLRADLASLQARTVSARANLTRLETLAQRSMASQQDLVAARAEATALEADAGAARQRLQALGLGSRGNVSVFSLRAPMSGYVMERGVVPGQAVLPEQVVATIVNLDRVWFVARIFEHMLADVQLGAAAEVELNAHPDHPFAGTVEYLAPKVDEDAQTVVVRIPIDNREGLLRLGLFGSARIAMADPGAEHKPVLAVPRDAVIDVAGETVVFVAGEGGVFEPHEVVLGAVGAGVVEVVQGLDEGDRVVSHGAWSLKSVLLKPTFGDHHGH